MKIAYYLPENKITNEEIFALSGNDPEWSDEQIIKKCGIKLRHIADEGELSSDMCVKAAKKLFGEYDINPSEIDFVVLCTQSPDYLIPATAFLIHEKLGLKKECGAFDINIACSGYTYGLGVAKGLILGGFARKVLLCTSDMSATSSKFQPLSERILFSDSATATVLDESNIDKIDKCVFGSDGSGFFSMYSKYGGRAYPINAQTHEEVFKDNGGITPMRGEEVFLFTIKEVPNLVKNIAKANNLSLDEIDFFIFHQANILILNALIKILKLPKEKVIIDIEEVGNTSSNSIAITLKRAIESNKIAIEGEQCGIKVLIAGFGIGLSWSGTILSL